MAGGIGWGNVMDRHEYARSAEDRTPLYVDLPGRPLRVVLVAPPTVPGWLAAFVAECVEGGPVELVVVCLEKAPPAERPRVRLDLMLFLGLERILTKLLGRVTGRVPTGALAKTRLVPSPCETTYADTASLLAGVQDRAPDLVLLHGNAGLAGAFAAMAAHGCWVLDPDLTDPLYAGLSLLDPIVERNTATRLGLYLVPEVEGAAPVELTASWGATSAMSFSQQRDIAFAKLPAMLLRVLRGRAGAQVAGPGRVGTLRTAPPSFASRSGMGLRSFLEAARQFLQWRGRRIRARLPWFVLLPTGGQPLDPGAPVLERHLGLVAPGNDYWADPYPVELDGRRLVFVEELVHAMNKGVIVCLELLADGTAVRHGLVLEEEAHLSYPQVFQWKGTWYMTVESCEARRVSLYIAEEFPLRWRRVTDLIEGREAVDPTLHHQDGVWYLFANISESGGGLSDELFLFTSEALAGPYRPHPANPVLCDARSSRPAGRLFHHGGRLVRPAQCCVPIYGTAIVFNEVLELSPQAYRERPMATLGMDGEPTLDGCHTYNAWDGFEVLDAHGRPPDAASRMAVVAPDKKRATL